MSRIRNRLVRTATVAAGLFLGALATSTAATAEPVPANPAPVLPDLVEQVVGSSAGIPQQLLQTTTSALTGAPAAPALPGMPASRGLSNMLPGLGLAPPIGVPPVIPGLS